MFQSLIKNKKERHIKYEIFLFGFYVILATPLALFNGHKTVLTANVNLTASDTP